MTDRRPVRIANVSGFFGDRPTAMREQLDGGPVDVLCGDYLAELTMLILARTQQRRPDGGFARTFIADLEGVLDDVVARQVKVVVNAGGLDPAGCASAVREMAARHGLDPVIAWIGGDDIRQRLGELAGAGESFMNSQTGADPDTVAQFVTANAYLGGWGITEALRAGADIVITGRVTDAALVSGPAAWWHGWERHDYDRLAGAVVAGHVIECGMQATGGNFSFFEEIAEFGLPGFPWADIASDGSAVIGKADNTGGAVTRDTVVSQLLYEIGAPAYLNPDVTARFDTIEVTEAGVDRVGLSGVRGEAPPGTLKVAASMIGGHRNSVMVGLTGPRITAKAELVSRQVWAALGTTEADYDDVAEDVIGSETEDSSTNEAATAFWRLAVASHDENLVGRQFSNTVTHLALGSIPGLFGLTPPGPATPFALYWPTTVSRDKVHQEVHVADTVFMIAETEPLPGPDIPPPRPVTAMPGSDTIRIPLGALCGARSGDKGGAANIGIFARSDQAYAWLAHHLTIERVRTLIAETSTLRIDRYELPNLRALNFVIHGLLGEGVSSSLRVDPQAKGLAEYLRSRHVDVPIDLLDKEH